MSDNNKVPYSVHVHFHGTPTPEFLEAFNRMLDIAAAAADSSILNGEIRESCGEFCQDKSGYTPIVDKTLSTPPNDGSGLQNSQERT